MTTSTTAAPSSTPAVPAEVVTHTPVQDVALPGGAGTLALVTLENGQDHTRPTTFGPHGIAELAATVGRLRERAEAGEIQAVAITGKPFVFAVGADLSGIPYVVERRAGDRVRRRGARRHSRRSWTCRSRRSPSSTARRWAAGSSSPSPATTGASRPVSPPSPCPRPSSGCSPAGAAATSCRTSSGRRMLSRSSSRTPSRRTGCSPRRRSPPWGSRTSSSSRPTSSRTRCAGLPALFPAPPAGSARRSTVTRPSGTRPVMPRGRSCSRSRRGGPRVRCAPSSSSAPREPPPARRPSPPRTRRWATSR